MKSKSVMSRVYTCASRSRHIFRRVVVSVWIGILSLQNSSFTRGLVICPRLDAWSCLLRFRRCLERRSPRYDHWFHGGLEPLASYKDSWFPVRHVYCIILHYAVYIYLYNLSCRGMLFLHEPKPDRLGGSSISAGLTVLPEPTEHTHWVPWWSRKFLFFGYVHGSGFRSNIICSLSSHGTI